MSEYTDLKRTPLSAELMTAEQIEEFVNKRDYTAFEVLPTDRIIAIGEKDDSVENGGTGFGAPYTGLTYKVAVDTGDTSYLRFETTCIKDNCNIVIDWGDNCKSIIKDMEIGITYEDGSTLSRYDEEYDGCPIVEITHKYSVPNKKYIEKIYGTCYTMVRTNNGNKNAPIRSIVSRAFEKDLPIASCVLNMSSGIGNFNERGTLPS